MRLRFTIRDLLWLTLVVALIVVWKLDRRDVARERDGWQREYYRATVDIEDLAAQKKATQERNDELNLMLEELAH